MVLAMRKYFGISAVSFCILKPSKNVLRLVGIPIIIYTTVHTFNFGFCSAESIKNLRLKFQLTET